MADDQPKQSGNFALIVSVIIALIGLATAVIVPIINNNAAQEQASREREFELTRDSLALTNDAVRTQSARDLARTETAEAVVLVPTTSIPTATLPPPSTTVAPTATETPIPPTNTLPPTEAAVSTNAPAPTQPPPTNTSAPTSPPVVIPTQAPIAVPASFPCEATIVNPQGGTTQINNFYSEASTSSSRTGRAIRVGQAIEVHRRSIASDGGVWYLAYTLETDRLGWITSQYLNLSAACPSND